MTTETIPPCLCWHVHHNTLAEWCYDYQGRVNYINDQKLEQERPTRLRLFQPVKGPIPPALREAAAAWREAAAARREADAAWREATAAWREADAAWNKADAALREAYAARSKADAARSKAYAALWEADAALSKACDKHMPELLALHALECVDCPWDGQTIFPALKQAIRKLGLPCAAEIGSVKKGRRSCPRRAVSLHRTRLSVIAYCARHSIRAGNPKYTSPLQHDNR